MTVLWCLHVHCRQPCDHFVQLLSLAPLLV